MNGNEQLRSIATHALACGLGGCAVVGAVLAAVITGKPTGEPDTDPIMVEFICEEGDDITESWVGLESAVLVKGGANMWELTSNTGDITHFVQKPGQRCSSIAYPVESVETSSTRG